MNIELGKKVYCTDLEVGNLSRVVLETEAFDISQLVVDSGLSKPERLVPITQVEKIDEAGIKLALTSTEFERLPEFMEQEHQPLDRLAEEERTRAMRRFNTEAYTPMTGSYYIPYTPVIPLTAPLPDAAVVEHENLAPGERAVTEGMDVYSSDDQKLGSVMEVSYDAADKRLESLEIEKGLIFTSHRTIPADWIGEIEADRIKLNRTKDQIKEMQRLQEQP